MNEKLKKICSGLLKKWKSLSRTKKIAFFGILASVVGAAVIVAALSNTVHYSPLYLGLDASEAGQVYDKVQAMNVPVKTEGTGNIYVDSRQVDTVKMKLAEAGYPQTSLSYDIFMKGTTWAMTDSDKEKLALYQVQNRLQDTIKTISGVTSAEVTIGQKEDNSYVLSNDNTPATASVKLNTAIGVTLDSQQVRGIVLLVSKSVPGLDKKNVTVVGNDGSPLTESDLDDDAAGGSSRLELQKKVETMVHTKLMSLLGPIFGAKNIQVASNAALDFSSSSTNKTTYNPQQNGQGVPQTENKTVQPNGNGTGQTQYPTGTASQGASGSAAQNEQTTYLVDTINQQIQDSGEKLTSLTVSVIINNRTDAAQQDPTTLKQTIANAVGTDVKNVSIQFSPFADNSAVQVAKPAQSSAMSPIEMGAGALAVLLIVAAAAAFLMIRKRSRKEKLASQLAEMQETENMPVQRMINSAVKNSHKDAVAEESRPAIPTPEEREKKEEDEKFTAAKKQVDKFATDKPEIVAQLIKNWLKE